MGGTLTQTHMRIERMHDLIGARKTGPSSHARVGPVGADQQPCVYGIMPVFVVQKHPNQILVPLEPGRSGVQHQLGTRFSCFLSERRVESGTIYG
jgi:hypothetical protein